MMKSAQSPLPSPDRVKEFLEQVAAGNNVLKAAKFFPEYMQILKNKAAKTEDAAAYMNEQIDILLATKDTNGDAFNHQLLYKLLNESTIFQEVKQKKIEGDLIEIRSNILTYYVALREWIEVATMHVRSGSKKELPLEILKKIGSNIKLVNEESFAQLHNKVHQQCLDKYSEALDILFFSKRSEFKGLTENDLSAKVFESLMSNCFGDNFAHLITGGNVHDAFTLRGYDIISTLYFKEDIELREVSDNEAEILELSKGARAVFPIMTKEKESAKRICPYPISQVSYNFGKLCKLMNYSTQEKRVNTEEGYGFVGIGAFIMRAIPVITEREVAKVQKIRGYGLVAYEQSYPTFLDKCNSFISFEEGKKKEVPEKSNVAGNTQDFEKSFKF